MVRWTLTVLAACAAGAGAFAQESDQDYFLGPGAEPPLESAGGSTAPSASSSPAVDAKATYIQLVPERDTVVYSGSVEITYQDSVITADNCTFETGKNQAVFTGHVRVQWQDQVIEAVWVWVDFEHAIYQAKECRLELPPSFFGSEVSAPIYVWGERLEGDREELVIHDAFVTPCDRYRDPHLGASASRVRVYRRGKHVETSAIKLKAKGHTFFWFPGFSIRTRWFTRGDIFPTIGQNSYEGLWGETRYLYNSNGAIDVRVTELQGTKISHDYSYELGNSGYGSSLITYGTMSGNLTGRLSHSQRFGQSTNLTGSYDLRQSSAAVSTQSTTQAANLSLSRNVGRTSLTANYTQNTTTTTQTRSNTTAGVTLARELWGETQRANAEGSVQYSSYDVGDGLYDRELNANLEFRQPTDVADFEVVYDRRFDLDGTEYTGDDGYSNLDRRPNATASIDFRDWGLELQSFTSRGRVSLGRFVDTANEIDRLRLAMDLEGAYSPIRIGKSTTATLAGAFQQRVYRSDEALYTLGSQATLRSKFGTAAALDLGWNWKTYDGYTPFRQDYATKQHSVRAALKLTPDKGTQADVSSSYDIQAGRWGDIRMAFSRRKGLSNLTASTGYDLQNHRWRSLNVSYNYTKINRYYLSLSGLYNLYENQLSTVSSQFDVSLHRNWRLEWQARFDGGRGEFSTSKFRLTWEHHDLYSSLSYDIPRNQFEFGLTLKAFPSFKTGSSLLSGSSSSLVDTTLPTGGGF